MGPTPRLTQKAKYDSQPRFRASEYIEDIIVLQQMFHVITLFEKLGLGLG